MSRKIKKYGWIPDLPDHRDHLYAAPQPVLVKLPKKVDLRTQCPPVFNQKLSPPHFRGRAITSDLVGVVCQPSRMASNSIREGVGAIAAAHQFDQMKQNKPTVFTPSRLFIYYNEREIEGTVKEDTGAMICDGIKSLVKQSAASVNYMNAFNKQK